MKNKKILSLSDLYEFFSSKKENVVYDSKHSRSNMVVHVDGDMRFDEDTYDPNKLKAFADLRMCHTNENINASFISEDSMSQAMASAVDIPILAYIFKDGDGEYQFAGHEMFENEDGEIEYEEIPVGVMGGNSNLHFEDSESGDKKYLCGMGTIWKEYTKAYDILKRDGEHPVSIEINIDKLEYSADEDMLYINEFHFKGVTILGKDRMTGRDLEPGMEGANITLNDFNSKNNALFTKAIVDAVLKQVYQTLEEDKKKKGGDQVDKFNELLKQYNKTAEDVTFEYADLSDEELEAKFAEVFGETSNPDEGDAAPEGDAESTGDAGTSETSEGDGGASDTAEFSVTRNNNTRTFALSYDDIRWQLYDQFNEAHATEDDWFCVVDVFDNDTAIFQNWNGKYYRQSFERNEDTVTLSGDAVEVFISFVTEAERTALDMLQANYDSTVAELEKYQAAEEAEKKNTLMSESYYSVIAESEEFAALKNDMANLTYDELKDKADALLLAHYKSEKLAETETSTTETFSANEDSAQANYSVTELPTTNDEAKPSRYEGLF